MPIKVKCVKCGRTLTAPDGAGGKRAKCPSCGTIQRLPVIEPEVLEPEPVPEPTDQGGYDQGGYGQGAPADQGYGQQSYGAPGGGGYDEDPFSQPAYTPPPVGAPPAGGGGYGMTPPAYTPPPYGAPAGGGGAAAPGGARKPCPMCGEMIPVKAMKCSFCNEILDPKLKKHAARNANVAAGDEDLSGGEWVFAILCSGIACIVGIIWLIQGKPKAKKLLLIAIIADVVKAGIRFAIEANN